MKTMTDKNHFLKKVKDNISEYCMIGEGETVLVALSGGADSVALIYALKEIISDERLKAAHFNHLLRGEESERDENFSRNLCKDLSICFFSGEGDVKKYAKEKKLSIEEAARILRYSFLENIMKTHKFSKIATAHHLDDNSELVLMNIIRGTGLSGLSGIPPVRGKIIRPFINVSRNEILSFLGKRNFVTDSSNSDNDFLRNRVRNNLIPYIKKDFNPSLSESLNRLTGILRNDNDYLDKKTEEIFNEISRQKDDSIIISAGKLKNLHFSIASRVIRKAVLKVNGNLRKFTFTNISDIIETLDKNGSKFIDLPQRIRVEKNYDSLIIKKHQCSLREIPKTKSEDYSFQLNGDCEIEIPSFGLLKFETQEKIGKKKNRVLYLDKKKLSFPLKIRSVKFGDTFRPIGFKGKVKIKKFFNSLKIEGSERWNTPVLLNSEEIVMLCGYVESKDYSADKETSPVLKVELSLA